MRWTIGVLAAALALPASAEQFLFAYFIRNGERGVHFALSSDGFQWTALKNDEPWLPPAKPGELMRDPFIARGPDGKYHMVWTWDWTLPKIGYAWSRDLITWSEQREIPTFPGVAGVKNAWAPELWWDGRKGEWLVFWSATIEGRFPETAGQARDKNHRIYVMRTRDFASFSEPAVFYDPGYPVIDATLFRKGAEVCMVFKDEREAPLKKFLQWTCAPDAAGPWAKPSEPFTGTWSEGPSVLKLGSEWLVYYDHYRDPAGYRALSTSDWKTWADATGRLQFPTGAKHGSFLRITDRDAERLRAVK
jgi:hypothetical protein